jgi:hypothetical protein
MGEEEKGFPILCNTLLGKVDYGYKWHARAEYAIEYTRVHAARGFGKTIDKSKH